MSYDAEPEPQKKKRRPLEDPVAIDAARARTVQEKADELRRAMSLGPGGQKRALAKLFGQRVKEFKKVLRRVGNRHREVSHERRSRRHVFGPDE